MKECLYLDFVMTVSVTRYAIIMNVGFYHQSMTTMFYLWVILETVVSVLFTNTRTR